MTHSNLLQQHNKYSSADSALPLVIVNPKSASGATRSNWSAIASDMRTHFGPFAVAFTKAPGDGIGIARRAAESGRDFIIACGGDGTINEVANGILLAGGGAELGVIPSGTGGDFRRTIGIPQTSRDAARTLRDGRTEIIDVGKVAFVDHGGETVLRYYLNVSSFGLAASIIERVKGSMSMAWLPANAIRGRASFALSTLHEVAGLDATAVKIRIDDGEEKSVGTINFCVANSRFFGGGMKIAPDAKLTDGLLDIVNIGDIRTAKILLNAFTLYRGTHIDLSEVKCTLARRVEARAADERTEIHIEVDGELPGRLPATYEVVPRALKLRVPSN